MLDLDIRQAIIQVQQGRNEVREMLIQQYLPFILKVTSQSCNRYVHLGQDDEVSVALIAFNEALDKYDTEKDTSFFTFAETVIKRRIIDNFRKNNKDGKSLPWSSLVQDGDKEVIHKLDKLTWQESQDRHKEEEIARHRREEIMEYQKKLRDFGITLQDLVAASPKHQDARATAFQVARIICENRKYRKYLEEKKALPLKELESEVSISRKTLERQRKYIIALSIVLMGDFTYLGDYIEGLKG